MKKKELLKLADKYQAKADAASQNYQETGMGRYGSAYRRNEELADALRMAAGAADEHHAYVSMKAQMSNFAWRAKMASTAKNEANRSELVAALVRDIVSYGHLMGLIGNSIDRIDQATNLTYLDQLSFECKSMFCQFNHGGMCRFALVHERAPRNTDRVCAEYSFREEA